MFRNFCNVIFALFLREIQSRFGSKKLGYFWAIFEPFAFIAVFAFIRSSVFNTQINGVNNAVFITISFLSFLLFRNIVKKALDAFDANSALFFYSAVKPIHTVITRILIELFITLILYIILCCIGWFFMINVIPDNVYLLLLSTFWLIWFSFSLGLLFAIIGTFYENFKRTIELILAPLMFVSAVFYSVDGMTPTFRDILLYNPLVHFMEMFRASYFSVMSLKYVDFLYLGFWTLVPCYLSLYIYIKAHKKIRAYV